MNVNADFLTIPEAASNSTRGTSICTVPLVKRQVVATLDQSTLVTSPRYQCLAGRRRNHNVATGTALHRRSHFRQPAKPLDGSHWRNQPPSVRDGRSAHGPRRALPSLARSCRGDDRTSRSHFTRLDLLSK